MATKRKKRPAWIYDVETMYNFFCLSAIKLNSDEVVQFVIDDDTGRNDREEIMKFFRDIYVIGYNNHKFDDIVVNFIIKTPETTANLLNQLATRMIECQRTVDGERALYENFGRWMGTLNDRYTSLDLIRLLFSKKLRTGLKELECSLNHDNVEELPYKPTDILTAEQKQKVLEYNVNDIRATKLVLQNSKEAIRLRQWVEANFGIKTYSMDGVALGMKIFEELLKKKLGGNESFVHHKTVRPEVHVSDILSPCIEFRTPEFQAVHKRYKNLVISRKDAEEELSLEDEEEVEVDSLKEEVDPEDQKEVTRKFKWLPKLFRHRFKYGIGGLHKDVLKGVWRTDDQYRTVSVDVRSYYPSLIIKWKYKPKHLPEEFYDVYQSILDERVTAKKAGDKMKDETLKLSVNGFFGNTNNPFSWAYDLQTTLATTINGQLMLSMMCEDFLLEEGFDLIDVNTDGIYLRYPRSKQARYEEIIKNWEEKTRMVLEETEFSEIYFLTSADYFGIDASGKEKAKGLFIDKVRLGKGMEFNVIAKAVKNYFLKGQDFREFINTHEEILDFCSYKKLSQKYSCFWKGAPQQRINRFYASRSGASLFKRKWDPKKNKLVTENVLKPSPVQLLNRLEKRDIKSYNINYGFYAKKAEGIIIKIEGVRAQTSLFAA